MIEVLVVDDEPDMRAFAARALTRSGCKVETVPNAMEGLSLLKKGRRFDVLVTDRAMPGSIDCERLAGRRS